MQEPTFALSQLDARTDRALSLVSLGLLALQAALDVREFPRATLAVAAAAVAAALLAARVARGPARPVAALAACVVVAMRLGVVWQLAMILALAGYGGLSRLVPALRPPEGWRAAGGLPKGWTALVGGVTPVALVGWLAIARPDLRDITGSELLQVSTPVLIAGGAVFAVLNATLEEAIWRGVLQPSLAAAWGARAAVALQAASFGAQHAHGFPRGLLGVFLAGSWAVMLGLLRQHSRGLLAPVLAHVVADATIAALVIGMIR
ncbi:CPBP family intramembrane glutamic endopeptidase [Sorangium sp. So ce1078]|uniref:CPBP family intramembrane glutamic endopeptidase n=1 Tax=Sorangium sp. So ce1078 TaxID=3133329 RepID=UPI003F5E72E2